MAIHTYSTRSRKKNWREEIKMTDIGRANPKVLIGLWWAGVISIVTFFIALWPMMGFIPPPAPTLTLQEYYDLIFDNAFLFRAGVIIVMISASLLLPITALMTYFIARMERGHTPLLAMTSFSCRHNQRLAHLAASCRLGGDRLSRGSKPSRHANAQ